MRTVTVAQTAGFCFGVRRAVNLAEQQAKKSGEIYAYGEIIHNAHEIARLEKLGVHTAESLEKIPDGVSVLIRAHGVPREVYRILTKKECQIFDATCPFVQNIHRIVEKESAEGRLIIIFGKLGHPEVTGIQGWCGASVVIEDEKQAKRFVEQVKSPDQPLAMAAQTTVNRALWNISVSEIKKRCTNLKIFDTICKATDERQSEARLLAGVSDQMIVIGDKKSSNTKRLYEISQSLCNRVLYVEDAVELATQKPAQDGHIGITAGASTPAWIIKEVSNMMSEETKIENGNVEEDFGALLEESLINTGDIVKAGDTVKGIISALTPEVQVDLKNAKQSAYIQTSELSDDPNYDPTTELKVGDEITCIVVRVNDGEGTIMLSKKRVDQKKGWDSIQKAYDEHTKVEGTIVEENRGGVVATAFGVRVFIPASQTGIPKDQSMAKLVKTQQNFYITEMNAQRKRVVGSIRQVLQEERRAAAENIWNSIEVGNEYDGVVKSLTSYGAFVDIGGVDGMVHISELSWGRIKHPSEIVNVGDAVKVFVIGLDKENRKISLGYKREEDNPWNIFKSKYQIGDTAEVKILKFMPFGAFAEIVPGVDGLIHISQIATKRIARPEDELDIGELVDAKIIDINEEKKKVNLSIRALKSEETYE